jgi:hypothetical protein
LNTDPNWPAVIIALAYFLMVYMIVKSLGATIRTAAILTALTGLMAVLPHILSALGVA